MLKHWSHVPSAFDDQIEHFVDNFMKPGNLEGGFAWYRAAHAARVALVRGLDGSTSGVLRRLLKGPAISSISKRQDPQTNA